MRKTLSKVALIYPRGGNVKQGMPLAFGCLKSNTTHDIQIIDCMLDDIDFDSPKFANRIRELTPGVVGISSWSFNFLGALAVLKAVKQINPNITTIWGGPHATSVAEKVIENKEVDFVFRGEAEFSFQLFLDELFKPTPDYARVEGLVCKDGENTISNGIARIEDLDSIKLPDYNSINLEQYIKKGYWYQNSQKRNAPIQATRGCPYRCAFCAVPVTSGRRVRRHSIEYMIEWIKFLYKEHGIRGFNIVDDNFTLDIEYAKAFCRAVIKLGHNDIEFINPNGIRMQRGNSGLWSLMRKAGWRVAFVAPESGSERVLKSMKKALDLKQVPDTIRDIRKAGLQVHGFFMIGYPGEMREDLFKTGLLIRECAFDGLSITAFQPMPGTSIYNELVEKGEIADDFLPALFGDFKDYGNRGYVNPTLKDFNFTGFVSKLTKFKIANPLRFIRSEVRLSWKLPVKILSHPLVVYRVFVAIIKLYAKRLAHRI